MRMINARLKAVVLVLLLGSFSALVHSEQSITIASGEYPPWTSESLPHGGYMNLIVSLAFKESGIQVNYEYMPWNRALEATKQGKYPASSFWGYDPARGNTVRYSNVILTDPIVLFYNTKRPVSHWENLADLKEYRFGATRGYTYSRGFWELAKQDVLRVSVANDDIENLRKLIDGTIDIFPISQLTGNFLLSRNFRKAERIQIESDSKPINSSEDFLLFSSAWQGVDSLISKFNSGLQIVKDKGYLEKYHEEFLSNCCE